jgi:enoyl-CoA hydratase/carnithine racemase
MNTDSVLLEKNTASGVAILTLNRPKQFNSFNREMVNRWADLLIEVSQDKAIHALVVTGSGKAFCAGGDMDELASFLTMPMMERKAYLTDNVHRVARALNDMDIPVIAALNGTARGAGLDMALMCDIRVADRSVMVAESYVALGLVPGDGGSYLLPRLIGMSRALELLWTGDAINAEQAERIGMISHVVDDGQALNKARELAERIAKQPTDAVRLIKRAALQSVNMTFTAHLDMISSHMAILEDGDAFRQRLTAFREQQKSKKA